ncbi:MAG TPA: transcription termination/antitermination protein NusG, partial [Anaerolineae bacterium]|nr:transcription termination/antitermination protein NusG [Anaerolineae bacterium]
MPGMDGITASERISQSVPFTQIVMMSVQGEADYLRRSMLAGAREFLIKPFSSDELMTSIRRVYQSAALQKSPSTPKTSPIQDVFKDLKERIQAKLLAQLDPTIDISRPNELGRTILQDKFDQILAQENIILSRSERERLFESIVTEILQTELDETQKRAVAQWFKFFKLGNNVEISLSVANLSGSVNFYKKLGFERVDGGEKPYPWAVVSDGQLYLGLHQRAFSSPTLSYFMLHGLSERMDHLPKLGISLDNIQNLNPIQGMHDNKLLYGTKFLTAEFESPEGQRVLLADICSDVETTPAGRKFFSKYEAFGELSLNTNDVKAALAYWEKLGFECLAEGDQPYPWVIISDGRIRLGLHQTSKLTQPTITYFAPDMPERLKRLRRRGVQFVAEHKDKKGRRVGAVIESPDGQRFFLFAGEIRPQKNGQNKDSGRVSQEVYPDKDSSQPEAAQWYMIYSYSGQETKVRQNLLHRVETLGMRDKIFQVVVPADPSVPLQISGSSFLSGSLLVEMVMDEDSWYIVKNTPGVTGFVGADNKPTPLPPAEVDKLLKHLKAEALQINGRFKVGQMVRIVEGPFEDFMGTVDEVDLERARVRVRLSFFGQEKSIELDFLQVEPA